MFLRISTNGDWERMSSSLVGIGSARIDDVKSARRIVAMHRCIAHINDDFLGDAEKREARLICVSPCANLGKAMAGASPTITKCTTSLRGPHLVALTPGEFPEVTPQQPQVSPPGARWVMPPFQSAPVLGDARPSLHTDGAHSNLSEELKCVTSKEFQF